MLSFYIHIWKIIFHVFIFLLTYIIILAIRTPLFSLSVFFFVRNWKLKLLVKFRVETWFQNPVRAIPKILLPQFENTRNHTIMTSFVRYLSYFLNSRTWTIRRYSNTILYILKYVLNWYFVFRFIYFLRARKIAKNGPSRAKMDIHIGYLHDIKHLNVSLDT